MITRRSHCEFEDSYFSNEGSINESRNRWTGRNGTGA